ncbi:MAG: VCBS repeat-containing protein [Proteobacteria bacterium]|nr:VCBS repeat-containing protein [Pseudomonadota bacterium]
MRNKLWSAGVCLLAAAVLYAADPTDVDQAAAALVDNGSAAMSAMGFNAMTAAVPPDQTVQSLASELPTHDPSVGRLAGTAGTSGGSATYNVPIVLPPGRHGMQPDLALSYSSRSGNGIAGMGWSLSGLSSLHRCPQTLEQDGQVVPVALTNADKLCLDGMRLVATAGTYGQSGTTYDTEIDSFSRVTQLGGDLQSSSTYFKVESKDGDILWYGNNATGSNPARVIPGGASTPLTWMLARKEDRIGNFERFAYGDYGNGESLLTDVFYTGFGSTDGDRSVHFTYQPRPSSGTDNDVSSSYLAGAVTMQTQRLASISTWSGTSSNANNEVRQYTLSYATSQSTHRSLLQSVTECAYLSGNPSCRLPTTFSWQQGPMQSSFHLATLSSDPNVNQQLTVNSIVGDYDGDGSHEILANLGTASNQNFYLISLNPDRSIKTSLDLSAVPGIGAYSFSDPESSSDFDLDGKNDMVTLDPSTNHVLVYFWDGPGTATTFAQAFTRVWDTGVTGFNPGSGGGLYAVRDMDGDGRPDIVTTTLNPSNPSCYTQVHVFRNVANPTNPSLPASFPELTSACLASQQVVQGGLWYGETVSSIHDVNGDGLPDIVVSYYPAGSDPGTVHLTSILMAHRTPGGLSYTEVPYGSFFPASDPLQAYENYPQGLTLWMDVNGDGVDDLVNSGPSGQWVIRLGTGNGFGPRIFTGSYSGAGNCGVDQSSKPMNPTCSQVWQPWYASRFQVSDIDGDGRKELLYPNNYAALICNQYLHNGSSGEPELYFGCPGGIAPASIAGQDVRDLYFIGLGSQDQSSYQMNALHFVQTGPNQFRGVDEVTTQVSGWNNSRSSVFGNGLESGITHVQCRYGKCIPNTDPGYPSTLPGGYPVHNGVGIYGGPPPGPFINDNTGPNGQANLDGITPELPDLMSMATDGMGGQTVWTYYPLSSAAGRTAGQTPLYTIPSNPSQRYIDAANVYFNTSMPVVSDMSTSDGVGGFHSMRYGYSQAMFNQQGRGFQGFRTIIEEDLTAGLRTTTTFNQKFPLAGQVADVVVNAMTRQGTDGPIRHETYTWRCNRADRTDTTACTPQNGSTVVKFPFLDEHDTATFDATVALQATGTPQQVGLVQDINANDANCAGTIATTSGFDSYGNLLKHTVLSSDSGTGTGGFRAFVTQHCVNTSLSFTSTTSTWWLNKLNSTTVVTKIAYNAINHPLPSGVSNPLQTTTTSFTWNADRTLATQTVQAGVANQQTATAYTYPTPSYGLPSAVAIVASGDVDAGGNQRTRTSVISYSTDGYFPTSATNALSQTSYVTASPRDGQPTLTVDANGLRTLNTYDAFGQLIKTQYHGTSDSVQRLPDRQVALTWCRGCAGLSNALFQTTTVQDGAPTAITTHDVFGRAILVGAREQDGTLPLVQTIYDHLGRVQQQSTPYTTPAGQFWTTFLYDGMGRVTQKVVPKGAEDGRGDLVTTYAYGGLQTAIQVCGSNDQGASNCLNMTRTTDSLGRYMETVDALSGVTQYWYDGAGHTLALKDAKNSVTKAAYNAIGQRSSVTDPNQGTWSFGYDALGEVLSQTDARNVVTSTTYDVLSRPLSRSASVDENGDGVADAVLDSWTYDPASGVGEVGTSQRAMNGTTERSQSYIYDTLARLTQTNTHQQIAAGSYKDYTETLAYDGYYGRPKSIGYPNGEAVATYFSKYGHAIASFNPVDNTVYRQVTTVDARGNPTAAILGGASLSDFTGLIQDTRAFRPSTGELMSIAYAKGAASVRRLDYQSDVYGNLTRQALNTNATVESYTYDSLMRMTGSSRSGAVSATVSYGYDAAGNFTSKSDFSTTAASAYTYTGGTCGGGPNAVKSVKIATGGTRTYCYDADGNLTSDSAGLAVSYDHDNLPTITTRGGQTIWLAYGPDNQHTREWGSGDGTNVYLDGGYEDWITQGTSKVYIGTEAEITNGSAGRKVNYLLTDRLGSVDTIADATGALVETRGSDAFGKPRSGTWADLSPAQLQSTAITARGFTEHEHLNAVQLIHMNGRVYDYQLGRFLSVDPFIQFPLNSQSLNPYSYILNNPLAGTDPTGYASDDVVQGQCTIEGSTCVSASKDTGDCSATGGTCEPATKTNPHPDPPTGSHNKRAITSATPNFIKYIKKSGGGDDSAATGFAVWSFNGAQSQKTTTSSVPDAVNQQLHDSGTLGPTGFVQESPAQCQQWGDCGGQQPAEQNTNEGATDLNALHHSAHTMLLWTYRGANAAANVWLFFFGGEEIEGARAIKGGAQMLRDADAAESVWRLNPFQRGQQIERALGQNLPYNFPVIDRFENGLATSIKSLDLNAKTYQNTAALSRVLRGYVDDVAAFNGRTWAGVRIRSQDISGRALDLAIPRGGSAAQRSVLSQTVRYGAARGVNVNTIVIP